MGFLLASYLSVLGQVNPAGPLYWPDQMPVDGTIYNGQLYGFFPLKRSVAEELSIFVLSINEVDRRPIRRILPDCVFDADLYRRHRLCHGALWHATGPCTTICMRLDELHLFDRTNPQREQQLKEKYPKPGAYHVELLIRALPKLQHKYNEILSIERRSDPYSPWRPAKGVVGVDIVPTAENKCRSFFYLKDKKALDTWETHYVRSKRDLGWNVHEDGLNMESFDCLFIEPFHAFVRKDDYFFVTESGKLYHAPPREEGQKTRKMREVWTEPTLPIVAILSDADNDKVWLFVKNKSKDAKADLYLEMRDVARFKEIDPAQLTKVKDVENPRARQLLEYIPLIRPELVKKPAP